MPKAAALRCDVVVCAPDVYLCTLGRALAPAELGAQNVSAHKAGAYTGDVSGEMLADVGCRWVIVGHSERRQLHGETDEIVAAKAARALDAGLRPIVCLGETLEQREGGAALKIVDQQVRESLSGFSRGPCSCLSAWSCFTAMVSRLIWSFSSK